LIMSAVDILKNNYSVKKVRELNMYFPF
jgi:hypothetical protein